MASSVLKPTNHANLLILSVTNYIIPDYYNSRKFSDFTQSPGKTVTTSGMYRISLFQIQLQPDLAEFVNSHPAGAGTGAGFENLVQHKTTPELD